MLVASSSDLLTAIIVLSLFILLLNIIIIYKLSKKPQSDDNISTESVAITSSGSKGTSTMLNADIVAAITATIAMLLDSESVAVDSQNRTGFIVKSIKRLK
ncbi:MAG: hypothetical protein LBU04_00010 [Christensenellaceae bacterium]|jgi:hypothetical protein|nr:hypothetical protein [Christensenellaceae bacterium]